MGHDLPQRKRRTVLSFRDVRISGPFSQSEDGELQIEGVFEGDVACHTLVVLPGGTLKGSVRADWVVIQGNFCGNIETSVFTATRDAIVIGGQITVYEKVLLEPGCLFRGEIDRPGEESGKPGKGFAAARLAEEAESMATPSASELGFTEGDAALLEAIAKGEPEIVARLLIAGADPNAAAPEGQTALTLAVASLRAEVASRLLEAGAEPERPNDAGERALMMATERGSSSLVEALLAGGADPNIAKEDGTTPLIEAVRRGRTEVARALIVGGADLEQRNAAGEMPMLLAKERGYKDTLDLLRQAAVGAIETAAQAEAAEAEARTEGPAEAHTEADVPPEPRAVTRQTAPNDTASAPEDPVEEDPAENDGPSGEAEADDAEPGPMEPGPVEPGPVGADPPEAGPPEAVPAEPDPPEPKAGILEPAPLDTTLPEAPAGPRAADAEPQPMNGLEPGVPATAPPAWHEAIQPAAQSREDAESILADLAPADNGEDTGPPPRPEPAPPADQTLDSQPADSALSGGLEADGELGEAQVMAADDIAGTQTAVAATTAPQQVAQDGADEPPDLDLTGGERQSREPEDSERVEPFFHIPGADDADPAEPAAQINGAAQAVAAPEVAAAAPQEVATETAAEAAEAVSEASPDTAAPKDKPAPEGEPAHTAGLPVVLSPSEVEALSGTVSGLLAPFTLQQASLPLGSAEETEGEAPVEALEQGVIQRLALPDPAPRSRSQIAMEKLGAAAGGAPTQVEVFRMPAEAAEAPQPKGEILLSLLEPDPALVYWPIGFRRLILHAGAEAGSYACDPDGNWTRSASPQPQPISCTAG